VGLARERLIVSGLAAGIDTAVHRETLRLGGRTLAVIGTGLHRCHPPQNRELAERIALSGALLSPFWPETPASRATFPIRTALMAALAATTVIAEAGEHSGTRIQARRALELGHRVLLLAPVLDQPWARELAAQTGVEVVRSPGELGAALDGSLSAGAGPR
jgi:DNA processing protein